MSSVISWNVNGIRAVEKKGFLEWLNAEKPDVLCLQETKARKEQLSGSLTAPELPDVKYCTYWAAAKKPGYSGKEASVISAYFPNSQEGGARLGYKLDFCRAMLEFCNSLCKKGKNVILCGDYNIAHKPIDLANPKANEKNPGYLPEERAWMDTFTASGYADTFRHFCSDAGCYTWWSYRFKAREKNIGWRIDYQCVNEAFLPKVKSSVILKDVTGSDHCPVKLVY